MATQRTYWECRICRRLFDSETQATGCEDHHADMSHFQVIDGIGSGEGFPDTILLNNAHDDTQLAEYKLSRRGAVSDFYQSDEPEWQHVS